jgi:hypothetical protein
MVTTSEPGRLKLTLRCVGSGAKCRRARTVTRTVSAGTGRVSLPSLRPGTWTATATVTDAAGNASRARSLRLRVPRPGYAT